MDERYQHDAPLLAALAAAPRGPARDGLYAVWLVARLAAEQVTETALPADAHAARLAAVRQRLRSLALPAPLRRGLAAALGALTEPGAYQGGLAIAQLAAPVRDTFGPAIEDAILRLCPPGSVPPLRPRPSPR